MPPPKRKSAVEIFEQGLGQRQPRPSAVDIFEQSQGAPSPQPPSAPPQGAYESFATDLAGKLLQYGIKPTAAFANAVGEATSGNFQPLKDIAESAGRGAMNIASAFDPTGAAYEPTVTSQAQRMQELRQAEEARLPETVRLMERGYQVEAAKPRTTAGKVAGAVGGFIGGAAPVLATGVLSGGSVPAVATAAALQSAAEPENLLLNVGSAITPIPIGKFVAPIIRRIRGNKVGAVIPAVEATAPASETGLNLQGMGKAISDNFRQALRDSVERTGKLPSPERGGSLDKAFEAAIASGQPRNATTLDSVLQSFQQSGAGTNANPQALAVAIGEDAFDAGKVKVADLGLEYVTPPSRPASAVPVRRDIPVSDITLGRDELSKGRMFQVEDALSQGGVKAEGETFTTMGGGKRQVQPITVVPDPREPGKFIVEDDGNHRVALLKLQGNNDLIPVKSFETEAQSGAVSQAVEENTANYYRAPTKMPQLEAVTGEEPELSVSYGEPKRYPGSVGPRINQYGMVEGSLEDLASRGGKAADMVGPQAQANMALEDGTAVAPAEKSGVLDTLVGLWKAGLLTRPNTHFRNIGGTGLFQISEEAARVPAAVADIVASAITNRRTISGPSITAFGKSAAEAATRGIKEAGEILRSGASAEDLASGELLKEINSGSRILDVYVNGVFRLLKAEDKIFRVYAYRRALEDRARSQALTEIRQGTITQGQLGERVRELVETKPTALQAAALADAEIATFNNENIVNRGLQGFKQGVAKYPGGKLLNYAIDTAAPFVKTPTNVIARMLDYSPIGLGKSAYKAAKGIATQAFSAEEQRAFAQTFGRGTIGTGLMVLGWKLYDAGLATGLYEDEPGKRTRDIAAGAIPGAVRIGDTWHQITGFSPLGNLVAIGASLARESEQERKDNADRIGPVVNVLKNAVEEQPLLQSAKNLTQDQGGPIAERLGAFAGSAVPGIVSDVGELIDQQQRQAAGQGFAAQIEKRIPGVRQTLPVATDVLGRPLEDRMTQVVDPTRSTTADQTPIIKELVRLDVGLTKLKKQPGEDDAAYRDKVSRFGAYYQQYGAALLSNDKYQQATDKQKKEALDSLSNRARAQIADEAKNQKRAEPAAYRLDPRLIMLGVLTRDREKQR